MEIFENFKGYIYNFFNKDDCNNHIDFYEIIYKNKDKNKQTLCSFEQIDFENTKTSDIVIYLNNLKDLYKFDSSYYENMYNINPTNKLTKLKYKLVLCITSSKDTTDIMIKHIMKYKGEKQVQNLKIIDEEYDKLEKRYSDLIKEDDFSDENNQGDDDDNNCKVLSRKKKICLSV